MEYYQAKISDFNPSLLSLLMPTYSLDPIAINSAQKKREFQECGYLHKDSVVVF